MKVWRPMVGRPQLCMFCHLQRLYFVPFCLVQCFLSLLSYHFHSCRYLAQVLGTTLVHECLFSSSDGLNGINVF